MFNNKKFLVLIIFIILLVPQLALMQTVQIGTCVDHKIFDQKSNKDTFWKCCWSNGNDDPAKWSPQQDIGTYCHVSPENATSGWGCYCRPYNMTVDPKVQAMLDKNKENAGKPIYFTPQVSVPGSDIVNEKKVALTNSTSLLSIYIVAIFKYSIGIIGIIAAIVLMFAGMRWLTAGGSSSAIGDARKLIAGSLTGLLLALVSFLLLTTINTKLTDLTAVDIKPVEKIDLTLEGCCEKQNPDGSWTSENISDKDCQDLKKKGFKATKFSYGLKADANKCSIDIRKKACCLYDKNKGGLYEGCYSNNLPLPESIIDFTNTCKEKINKDEKTYPDKWVHDDYQIQQLATCDCAQTGFCKCVDPK